MRTPLPVVPSKDKDVLQRVVLEAFANPFAAARGLEQGAFFLLDDDHAFGNLEFDFPSRGGESIGFFYSGIFADLHRDDSGQLRHRVALSLTMDPSECEKTCAITGLRYDEILLASRIVGYVIHVSSDRIINEYRSAVRAMLRGSGPQP